MRILLIDDDPNLCKVVSYQLRKDGFQVITANRGNDGLELFKKNGFDLVITDIQMPDISGMEVLQAIRRIDHRVIIIIITAYGSVDSAVMACRLGADDYLTKPFGQEQLRFVIEKALKISNLERENVQLRSELHGEYKFDNIIAHSPLMKQILIRAGQVAQSDATVLLMGESGTGKELIARGIHYNSNRSDQPFIIVNCPSIPANLLESELFGHVKGAYTGAVSERTGKFELAHGGTVFLDEIADLQGNLQAKLLRVLQEHTIEKVGSSQERKVDVRIIAATNRDLNQLMRDGRFREDLYYRLSVVPITIPPLREHREDIPFLVELFMNRYSKGRKINIEPNALNLLKQYDWPGNIRELENALEGILVFLSSDLISVDDIPQHISSPQQITAVKSSIQIESLATSERNLILNALKQTGGNQSQAAKLLQIPRHILLYRMKKYGIQY